MHDHLVSPSFCLAQEDESKVQTSPLTRARFDFSFPLLGSTFPLSSVHRSHPQRADTRYPAPINSSQRRTRDGEEGTDGRSSSPLEEDFVHHIGWGSGIRRRAGIVENPR